MNKEKLFLRIRGMIQVKWVKWVKCESCFFFVLFNRERELGIEFVPFFFFGWRLSSFSNACKVQC